MWAQFSAIIFPVLSNLTVKFLRGVPAVIRTVFTSHGWWQSPPLCWRWGCSPSPGLWCKEWGELFGCLVESWDRRGQSVMEWLLSLLLSCLPWHECPSSSTLKGTLLARGEWDILAADPRVGVKGNRGADEREHNYGQKTKSNLVSKQLFWWEGGLHGGEGVHNWDQAFSLAS